MLVDAVAFDGDESGADVGGANADLDGVAAGVGRLVELDLELGIAVERFGEVGLAGDAVAEFVELRAGGIAEDENEIAGLLRGQGEVAAAGGDADLARVAEDLFAAGDVFVCLIALLGEDGDVLELDPFEREALGRDGVEMLVDGEPVGMARRCRA